MENKPKYLTVEEAADEMRLSESTLRRRISERKINHYKVGGKILITPAEIERFMEANLKPARK
jgi:excisionase family DNA binding protein